MRAGGSPLCARQEAAGHDSRLRKPLEPPRLCTSVLKQVGLDVLVIALSTKRLKLCRNNDLQSKAKKRPLTWQQSCGRSARQMRPKCGCGAEVNWGLVSPRADWLVGMLGAL